jgi:serine protease Do
MKKLLACSMLLMLASMSEAAGPSRSDREDPLRQASGSIEALVGRVARSVVQVVVTGYRPVIHDSARTDVAFGRGRSIGSGVVIDSQGLILTNAHVVAGAERIDILLPTSDQGPAKLGGVAARAVEARLVGLANDLDLALLSIDMTGLPALPLADYEKVRQGELVFAFGSPDALRNSVTMGMVSAVARQTEPESPIVYIQTDAAINPGNSGGPLVNVDGELIGINTFIRSASGGSEGLGFALPSALVALAVPHLRDFGHLHRAAIGLVVQTVTPLLASGLALPSDAGLIISDVTPGSPAAAAGLTPGDIVEKIDGIPAESLTLARLYLQLYSLRVGQTIRFKVRRPDGPFTVDITAAEVPHTCERVALVDAGATLVESLGILGLPVDARMAAQLRVPSGVAVAVRVDRPHMPEGVLAQGDVIHAVNGVAVSTPEALRSAVERIEPRGAVVLQVERDGQLTYVSFERE